MSKELRPGSSAEARFFSFPTEIQSIVNTHSAALIERVISNRAQELYGLYEQDFLYLPEQASPNLQQFLADKYQHQEKNRFAVCAAVFREFDRLFDTLDWQVNEDEVIGFLRYRIDKEIGLLRRGTLADDYATIAAMPNARPVCKFIISQFALDYLTEASPLTRLLPGTFGNVQMEIFSIIADEYGNGKLSRKHSVLFQKTLRTLDMSDNIDTYRPYILTSVYMYMCHVNRVSCDKRLFLRFLGFLFVYEVCLIYPTQQQGMLLRQVFGDQVNIDYFDVHVAVDQVHGAWVVEKMLIPIIRKYGAAAAREILRGYHETLAFLSVSDFEIMNKVRVGTLPPYCLR